MVIKLQIYRAFCNFLRPVGGYYVWWVSWVWRSWDEKMNANPLILLEYFFSQYPHHTKKGFCHTHHPQNHSEGELYSA